LLTVLPIPISNGPALARTPRSCITTAAFTFSSFLWPLFLNEIITGICPAASYWSGMIMVLMCTLTSSSLDEDIGGVGTGVGTGVGVGTGTGVGTGVGPGLGPGVGFGLNPGGKFPPGVFPPGKFGFLGVSVGVGSKLPGNVGFPPTSNPPPMKPGPALKPPPINPGSALKPPPIKPGPALKPPPIKPGPASNPPPKNPEPALNPPPKNPDEASNPPPNPSASGIISSVAISIKETNGSFLVGFIVYDLF